MTDIPRCVRCDHIVFSHHARGCKGAYDGPGCGCEGYRGPGGELLDRAAVKVAVKYFWTGSHFYPDNLEHCIALPLEPVPEQMRAEMKGQDRANISEIPHWRFSPVVPWLDDPAGAPVKQTIATLPGRVIEPGNYWHVALLELTEDGYRFVDRS